jgi:hypothetical protein
VTHHVDVRRRRAARVRKRVRIERAADFHAGLRRDALRQARVGDVFKEDCSDLVLLDRVDDTGNVARARFRFGQTPSGAMNSRP